MASCELIDTSRNNAQEKARESVYLDFKMGRLGFLFQLRPDILSLWNGENDPAGNTSVLQPLLRRSSEFPLSSAPKAMLSDISFWIKDFFFFFLLLFHFFLEPNLFQLKFLWKPVHICELFLSHQNIILPDGSSANVTEYMAKKSTKV